MSNYVAPVTLSNRIRQMRRRRLREDGTRMRQAHVVGDALGEQLSLAAAWTVNGQHETARAVALLAVAGLKDTEANRAVLLRSIEQITGSVRLAVTGYTGAI